MNSVSIGQNLENYQWENRVLLVFSDTKMNKDLVKQLAFLAKEKEGLQERKLKIITYSENSYAEDFNSKWMSSTIDLNEFKDASQNKYSVFLIGLDGGIKHSQTTPITTKTLFSIIDVMPMRKRELRIKN